jgi:hypothetical protein
MYTYFAESGESIYRAVERIKKAWQIADARCYLVFNDIKLIVSVDSNPEDIAEIYNLKIELLRLKNRYV